MPKLNMKKYIYPIIITALFLVGFSNFALASWYNPFSWFQETIQEIESLNLGAPSTELIYQKTILPITDSAYDLGTTTKAWRNAYIDQVCLTGDSCQTAWPASLSGGSANLLTYWTSATEVGATSSPTVGYITATSTATSTFAGSLAITEANATSTFAGGLDLSDGCFAIDGTCLSSSAGTVTSVAMTVPTGLTISG